MGQVELPPPRRKRCLSSYPGREMCAQKISSIVWGWTLSTDFVYRTDCFCEVVCSGESPSSSRLLAKERVRFTGSPGVWPRKATKEQISWGTSGVCLGLPQKAKSWPCFVLFYFKIECATEWWSFHPSWLLELIFLCHHDIPCQLTSAHFRMCCWDSESSFPQNLFCQKHHAPNRTSSLAPICSESVSRWCLQSTRFTPLARRPLGISARVVSDDALHLACGTDTNY